LPRQPKQIVVSHQQIGERIKLLRQDQGLTQVALAKRLELTQSNLSAIERGARGVTVNQVVRIAKALGASTDEILLDRKAPETGKRPAKKLMRHLRRVDDLTEADQRILLQLLDGLLMQRAAKSRRREALKSQAKDSRVA
jgi:transcriptional regulator with XRE-family HTH domain